MEPILKRNSIIRGLPIDTYHESWAISKSNLSSMKKSWNHYTTAKKEKADSDSKNLLFGNAFHKLMESAEEFHKTYKVCPKFDLRTKEGKIGKANFEADNIGKLFVDQDEMDTLLAMKVSILSNMEAIKYIGGTPELSFFWESEGVFYKSRPDVFDEFSYVACDYKTSKDASPEAFAKDAINYGYDWQAAMCIDGINACYGSNVCKRFIFIVVEKDPPYGVAIYDIDDSSLAIARESYKSITSIAKPYHKSMKEFGVIPSRLERATYEEKVVTLKLATWGRL